MDDVFGLPPEGHEDRLAFRLASKESALEGKILHMLAGQPRRYRDFRALVKGSETPVTRALQKLAMDGLLVKGLTSDPDDKEFRYSLTGLGVQVLFRSHEFKPVGEILSELRHSHILSA